MRSEELGIVWQIGIWQFGGAAALASPFGRGAPAGGGEGPLSLASLDSSPKGGAKALLRSATTSNLSTR